MYALRRRPSCLPFFFCPLAITLMHDLDAYASKPLFSKRACALYTMMVMMINVQHSCCHVKSNGGEGGLRLN